MKRICALALLFGNTAGQAALADDQTPFRTVIPYPDTAQVVARSALPLSSDAQTAYDTDFLPYSYFGAFAISKDGSYGYVTATNSLDAARDIAIGECQRYAPLCVIYAEIVPQGYVDVSAGEVVLNPEAADYFNDPGKHPAYRAMAVSADGAYSYVWGHATPADAVDAALADCESYRVRDIPGIADMPCWVLPGLR
jgi:hypothetical protein